MNVFIGELKYITLEELMQSSTTLATLPDNDITINGVKAESVIDSLCRVSETSENIKKAIVLLAECISKGEANRRIITSEKRRGNSVTFSEKTSPFESMHYCMTEEIYFYLRPYLKGGFFKQVI